MRVHTNNKNSPEGWGITSKEPMWTVDINDITQIVTNNC